MSILQSIIFGLVQGIAEFLPISSSGHLVIAQQIAGLQDPAAADMFFDMVLHAGTLVAVFFAFWGTIKELIIEFFKTIGQICTGKFSIKNANPMQRMIGCLIVSLIPLFIAFPFMDTLEHLYSSLFAVGIALLINSIILFLSDRVLTGKKTAANMNWKNALFVGVAQCIAITPGISRSGSTITAGLFSGLSRKYAAKYSFILSIPTILGGILVSFLDVVKSDAGLNTCLLYTSRCV